MRKAIATVSMSGTLREKLEAIAAARFDGYELFEPDLINYSGSPKELGALGADLGLACELYQPFRDFEGLPDAVFRRNLTRAERKFDVMQDLGAQLMLVCSNTRPDALPEPERAAEQLYALAELAAKRNLRIGFEALAWGRHVNLFRQAWAIVERANHPHLGLILDSFHTLSLKDDPAGIAQIPGDKIFFMQLADAPLLVMDVLQWARHYRNFPGQGQFDLETFFELVLRAGYTGPMSLEVFNDLFRESPNRGTAIDAMRSLVYLEGEVRNRLEADAGKQGDAGKACRRTLDRIMLTDLPSQPTLSGIAFLEFAVDESTARSLGVLLRELGFRYAGKHRSKEVRLFRQGDINFILNADPDSQARKHFEVHGPSVCAIGLRTDDPVRAVNRATALHCARFDSRVGPNEARVPAVKAPDGCIFYFVGSDLGADGLFKIDFELSAEKRTSAPQPGLTTVDHVAWGLPQDQLDTWVLFCRAVLGMTPGDSFELSDPFGLIRSSGVANADGSLRFVLNVSSSQRTRTARTVSASHGGGVHHIALASGDIFKTVETLRHEGVRFVPISPNYYDDIVARMDVDAGLMEKLRANGVLYDRNPAGGEFLHVYSESFGDRFFFEIVQRLGGYRGYGALNAPARMAAQAQAEAA
ncbi:MAG TPA: TIM barrel protein [Casimicrobiaceae bacterium]|nr:TIM barrel protein [Casimicrobiaceae bacterium]